MYRYQQHATKECTDITNGQTERWHWVRSRPSQERCTNPLVAFQMYSQIFTIRAGTEHPPPETADKSQKTLTDKVGTSSHWTSLICIHPNSGWGRYVSTQPSGIPSSP
jgi:hypothetical protein